MIRLAALILLTVALAMGASLMSGMPFGTALGISLCVLLVCVTWRGHRLRVAAGEIPPPLHRNDDGIGGAIHTARWLAAAAILGSGKSDLGQAETMAMTIPNGPPWWRHIAEFVDWVFLVFVLIPALFIILGGLKLLLWG
jgi:hypothetical protein